jgi:hypothetical protein
MKQGDIFAGRYALIVFGCGTECKIVLVGNLSTGRIYSFPTSGEDYRLLDLEFRRNSSLIIARWKGNDDKCRRRYMQWKEAGQSPKAWKLWKGAEGRAKTLALTLREEEISCEGIGGGWKIESGAH